MTAITKELESLFTIHQNLKNFNNLFKVKEVDDVKEIKQGDFMYHLSRLYYVKKLRVKADGKVRIYELLQEDGSCLKLLSTRLSTTSKGKYEVSFNLKEVYNELKDVYEISYEDFVTMLVQKIKENN